MKANKLLQRIFGFFLVIFFSMNIIISLLRGTPNVFPQDEFLLDIFDSLIIILGVLLILLSHKKQ